MKLIDLFLFGPPLLIGAGAWIAVWVFTRESRARRKLDRQQGPTA